MCYHRLIFVVPKSLILPINFWVGVVFYMIETGGAKVPAFLRHWDEETKAGLSVGAKVEVNHYGRGKFYPGKISLDRGDGTYDILYDDGESESQVAKEMIKSFPFPVNPALVDKFPVLEKVLAYLFAIVGLPLLLVLNIVNEVIIIPLMTQGTNFKVRIKYDETSKSYVIYNKEVKSKIPIIQTQCAVVEAASSTMESDEPGLELSESRGLLNGSVQSSSYHSIQSSAEATASIYEQEEEEVEKAKKAMKENAKKEWIYDGDHDFIGYGDIKEKEVTYFEKGDVIAMFDGLPGMDGGDLFESLLEDEKGTKEIKRCISETDDKIQNLNEKLESMHKETDEKLESMQKETDENLVGLNDKMDKIMQLLESKLPIF